MTLIIALEQPGLHCILSDLRVTAGSTGTNDAVKTGILFPGCIYGIVGNADCARSFVRSFREASRPYLTESPLALWNDFKQHIASYPYKRDNQEEDFELILSERSSGMPIFHLMSSREGILNKKNHSSSDYQFIDIVPFGSGATMVREAIEGSIKNRIVAYTQQYEEKDDASIIHAMEVVPYLFCLFLTELVMGIQRPSFEMNGVGGVFHFVWQSADTEKRQLPSRYFFIRIEETPELVDSTIGYLQVVPLSSGVGFTGHNLNRNDGFTRTIVVDGHADYDAELMTIDTGKELLEELKANEETLYFCGVTFLDAKYQHTFGHTVGSEYSIRILDNGEVDQFLKDAISLAVRDTKKP